MNKRVEMKDLTVTFVIPDSVSEEDILLPDRMK